MTKQEYLDELRKELKGLPKEDIDERISFYDEMISDMVEDGKSIEDAINEIGSAKNVANKTISDQPISKLVKEKIKIKRTPSVLTILIFILGFPLWFPLLLTLLILILVGLILTWVFVLIGFVVELSFIVSFVLSLVLFFISLFSGNIMLIYLGATILMAGLSILMFYGSIGLAKLMVKLNKGIILGIKKTLIK